MLVSSTLALEGIADPALAVGARALRGSPAQPVAGLGAGPAGAGAAAPPAPPTPPPNSLGVIWSAGNSVPHLLQEYYTLTMPQLSKKLALK